MASHNHNEPPQSPEYQAHSTTGTSHSGTFPGAGAGHGAHAQEQDHHVPTGYALRTGRKLAILLSLAAVGLGAGFFIVQHRKSTTDESLDAKTAAEATAPPPVDVMVVHNAPETEPMTLPGETRAWYESTIYARVNGYVDQWTANIGDHVTRGQVLATIDTPELDDELNAAQAKLKASDAQVNVMEANAAFAKSTYDRWWNSPKGVVSEQEREEKKAEFDSSVAKLNAAKAQVNLDQANVASLLALTQFKKVTAPFDGIITSRRIDIGNLVTAGSTANTTSLYSVAQSDKIRIFVDVPQDATAGISVGTSAVVISRDHAGQPITGKVARTANAIDPASRTLRAEVDIPNPDMALLPGMYVEVQFNLIQKAMVQVPAGALLFRSTGAQVAVVDPANKVTFRHVTIARDQGDMVELASGVNADERVALNISNAINNGDEVTVNEVGGPAAGNAQLNTKSATSGLSPAQPGREKVAEER